MNGSRPTPSRRGETSSLDALNRTIEGLEARIEGLMHPSREARPMPATDARDDYNDPYRGGERPQRPAAGAAMPGAASPLDEIRQRQRALDAARHVQREPGLRDPVLRDSALRDQGRIERASSERPMMERSPERQSERASLRQSLRAETRPLAHAPRGPVAGGALSGAVASNAAPSNIGLPGRLPDAIMNDIAEALVSLRQDLKQDISQGVAREMDGLRTEIRSIRAIAEDRHFADDLRGDLARLADSIANLGQGASAAAGETDTLRTEFEGLRAAMQGLAREDTVQRMESRMERQVQGLEDRVLDVDARSLDMKAMREELVSLAYRIDDIKTQLGAVGDSATVAPAIQALEDKLLTLASAVEHLGSRMTPQSDAMIVEQFTVLDQRLDEISRALAANGRASAAAAVDQGLMNRLENRIDGLADQIDAMHRDTLQSALAVAGPAAGPFDDEMGLRIEALARKIDDFSREQGEMRLDERLEDLAILMERVQQPAAPAELSQYLSEISQKIDALEQGSVNAVLAERLELLSRRIEEIEIAPAPADTALFGRLEGRLSDIAARLDDAAAAPAHDHHALRNLEDQIANLSRLISEPKPTAIVQMPAEFEDRMTAIEGYMATSDEYVIEAARQAAEAVVEAYARNGAVAAASGGAMPDMSALTGLAEDLRHLEDLTRGSEERTHQTFEMLHRTLVNIADRLDTMEGSLARQQAAPMAAPLAAAAAPARQQTMQAPAAPVMPRAAMPMFAGADDLHTSVAMPAPAPSEATGSDRIDEKALFAEDMEHGLLDHADAVDDLESAQRAAEKDIRAAVATKGGLLSGLTRFLPGQKVTVEKPARALVQPTPSIDPVDMLPAGQENEPLEPGSGMPDVKKILERVRASQAGMAQTPAADGESIDYIAAARRAAKAAAQETDPMQAAAAGARGRDKAGKAAKAGKTERIKAGDLRGARTSLKTAGGSGLGAAFARHRRPILMAVGAVLLALMAMPLVNTLTRGQKAPVAPPAIERQDSGSAAPAGERSPAPQLGPQSGSQLAPPSGSQTGSQSGFQSGAPSAPLPGPQSDAGQSATGAAERATDVAAVAPQAAAPVGADGDRAGAPVADVARAPLVPSQGEASPAAAQAGPQTPIDVPATIGPKSLADAASSGDPLALFEIASRYADGRGVAANLPEAARWYQLAADRGLAPAQYRIANLYEKGTGVTRDLAKAMTYYEQAANAGNASAMHNLAVLYASGAAGTPDYAKAVSWFQKAAELGVSDSQFNLAILYARGNGVPQNLDESYKWFAVAAKDGDQDAAQKRDEVANAMRPAQLESAKARVDLWKAQPVDPSANSVNLPDEWVGKGEKTASVDMEKAIRNIQAILNKNGFDAGQPDGKMGGKTTAAIIAFQKANGLTPDGKVSEPLVRKLLARNG